MTGPDPGAVYERAGLRYEVVGADMFCVTFRVAGLDRERMRTVERRQWARLMAEARLVESPPRKPCARFGCAETIPARSPWINRGTQPRQACSETCSRVLRTLKGG